MKKNYTSLATLGMIAGLLVALIFIFLAVKNKLDSQRNPLLSEEEKIKKMVYDITFVKPQNVFEAIRDERFMIIDTRNSQEFSENHIESSINIPLSSLAVSNPALEKNKVLIIVEEEETIEGKEAALKLQEADFKVNYLQGGLTTYLGVGYNLVSTGDTSSNQDRAKVRLENLESLGKRLNNGERFVYLDVRRSTDFEKDHFQNAVNIPLEKLEQDKNNIPTGKIIIFDEDPVRSFQAAVRLYDMNILSAYYLTNSYSGFKEAVKNKTLLP